MAEFFRRLFVSDFMPHGMCYLWQPGIIWLHVISDSIIVLSYFSIPITLLLFVRKRRDLPFHWIFLMFGLFILGCGATHFMEIWTIWHGTYRLAGVLKGVTAGASLFTAVALTLLVPKALLIPSRSELEKLNKDLAEEVNERVRGEQKLQALVEAAPDAMLVMDRKGNITLINAQVEKVFGFRREELENQRFDRLLPERLRGKYFNDVTGSSSQSGARLSGRFELYGIHQDGREFPMELSLSPLETGEGLIIGAIRDITERKSNEEAIQQINRMLEHRVAADLVSANKELEGFADSLARTQALLRESEDRFRTMVNAMPQLAWMARPDGFIFWYNQRWHNYTGTTPEQMEGWGWQSVHDPQVLPAVMERWTKSIATAQPFDMEFPLRGADGQFRMFLTRVEPSKDAEGRVIQWFGTNTDISDRKQAEQQIEAVNQVLTQKVEELQLANSELDAFTYSVSHDLRAPVRHLDGFAAHLRKRGYDQLDAPGQRYLDRITASAKQMGCLIDDLLAFSRLGRTDVSKTKIHLRQLFEEARLALQPDISSREVTWVIGELPEIYGDPAMLRQVLVNLLSNALKYSRDRTVARIEVGCMDDHPDFVTVFVRDNGVGFEMEYVHKLFNIFQRLHSNDYEGTGIGLANVRRIVERQGGRVWAEGAIDQGATFFFTLPRTLRLQDKINPQPVES